MDIFLRFWPTEFYPVFQNILLINKLALSLSFGTENAIPFDFYSRFTFQGLENVPGRITK
jgi:hypothetical protein